ncbi:MAG: tRNA uridine-5-carboxymethylaminomethyl(34) synthesis GTPase MnmE [Bacilli bacterium]|nr:tRNA uridine-5-carboxymethylaminomethyl(34) synthesis GTPase MnmE [Bacilli bacterium]MDD3421922.1 tRNA uridine-5-carboxymethylaminomethyl(34) synthesis GTPase MnmE [Bacilli bacterium]MDD4065721.1 tRNA uridine-5-carboxymethylaminomethyl(34) synthesis GTPase MnmE [Bacilli bacterium]
MQQITDTIVALATAPLQSALAIIRVSGKDSFDIISKVSTKKIELKGNNGIIHTKLHEGKQTIDEVLLFVFKGPHTFTGEDLVEISCHGGLVVINQIIALLIKQGARMAERGEFSERAFYHNKIDLLQAESINDLIVARNKDAANVALNGISGELSKQIQQLKEATVTLLSQIEVNIDYPEYEDIEELTAKTIKPEVAKLIKQTSIILQGANIGRTIKNGINVAIIGKPNVGKSSVLNALINEDKAIVSEIEGTTRDVVEGSTTIKGITFNFLDTAGIRKDADYLENIGIHKTLETISKADLVVLISANKGQLDEEEQDMLKKCAGKKVIVVFNKADLTKLKNGKQLAVSVKEHDIQPLLDAMTAYVGFDIKNYQNKPLLSNARQKGLIEKAYQNYVDAEKLCEDQQPADIIEIDIKEALNSLQELLGDLYGDNLSDEIFKRFCLGK